MSRSGEPQTKTGSRRQFLQNSGAILAGASLAAAPVLGNVHVAGDDDYLLKVRCRGTQDLDHLLAKELKEKVGVARTRTTIVLSTAKESVRVPVAEEGRGQLEAGERGERRHRKGTARKTNANRRAQDF